MNLFFVVSSALLISASLALSEIISENSEEFFLNTKEIDNIIFEPKKEINFDKEPYSPGKTTVPEIIEIFQYPVKNSESFYISLYGMRKDPIDGEKVFHHGVDIVGKRGDLIMATHDGKIIFAGWNGDFGKMVEKLSGDYLIRYAHLSSIEVSEGDMVKRGDVLGKLGSTGRTTGHHLHYEVREAETMNSINPIEKGFLPEKP